MAYGLRLLTAIVNYAALIYSFCIESWLMENIVLAKMSDFGGKGMPSASLKWKLFLHSLHYLLIQRVAYQNVWMADQI